MSEMNDSSVNKACEGGIGDALFSGTPITHEVLQYNLKVDLDWFQKRIVNSRANTKKILKQIKLIC